MLLATPTLTDVRNYQKAKVRKAKQKANKFNSKLATENKLNGLGSFKWAIVRTDICPYNSHGKTDFLIKAGAKVLAEKTKQGYKIWLTKGYYYTSIEEVKSNCRSYLVTKKALHTELKMLKDIVNLK